MISPRFAGVYNVKVVDRNPTPLIKLDKAKEERLIDEYESSMRLKGKMVSVYLSSLGPRIIGCNDSEGAGADFVTAQTDRYPEDLTQLTMELADDIDLTILRASRPAVLSFDSSYPRRHFQLITEPEEVSQALAASEANQKSERSAKPKLTLLQAIKKTVNAAAQAHVDTVRYTLEVDKEGDREIEEPRITTLFRTANNKKIEAILQLRKPDSLDSQVSFHRLLDKAQGQDTPLKLRHNPVYTLELVLPTKPSRSVMFYSPKGSFKEEDLEDTACVVMGSGSTKVLNCEALGAAVKIRLAELAATLMDRMEEAMRRQKPKRERGLELD